MAITFNGPLKTIYLDGATTVSIRGIYSRWVEWAASGDNLKWLPAFETVASPPTVPVYATLLSGWCVAPAAGNYTLTLNDGFLYRDGGGDPLCNAWGAGGEPRVRYENPVIAVGYAIDGAGGAPTAAQNAAAVLAAAAITPIHSDIRAVRGIAVNGTGSEVDPWGP